MIQPKGQMNRDPYAYWDHKFPSSKVQRMFDYWRNRSCIICRFRIGHRTHRTWLYVCTRSALAMTFHSRRSDCCAN